MKVGFVKKNHILNKYWSTSQRQAPCVDNFFFLHILKDSASGNIEEVIVKSLFIILYNYTKLMHFYKKMMTSNVWWIKGILIESSSK